MPIFAIALPLLPGKEAALRDFGAELRGPRRQAFDESQRRLGIPAEAWFLQKSDDGAMILVTFQAADPAKAFSQFARSREAFDVWFKHEVHEISGVDMEGPLPPFPEEILSYER